MKHLFTILFLLAYLVGVRSQGQTVTVTSVTRLTPTPTATAQVSYRVVFSGSVSGLTTSNFTPTVTGNINGASIFSVSGSGTTYTVVVNTGSTNSSGTLRLDVVNSTGTTPTISNVPYTAGEQYTITKSFAAGPTLRIQGAGSASDNNDVTAFVDLVQVLQSGTSTVVANAVQNNSFETNNVSPNGFLYQQTGVMASPWSFGVQAGVSRNGSAFGSTAFDGDAVAILQSVDGNNGSITQNLAVPTGSYQVRFRAIQRNYTSLDQRLNVFVNDVFVGNIQPNNIPTYDTFTSATFNVTAPALTATVSTNAASPTSTAPIPFTVNFSQNVGTTFVDSDVTVTGGTLTSGSFSGSGSGPYTFTVTPNGPGTVSVSLANNVAQDANNTGNFASNTVSVRYSLTPTITGFAAEPAVVCVGSPLTFTATVGNLTGSGTYTLTNGSSVRTGTLASGAFRETLTSSGTGEQRFTLTVSSSSGQSATAITPVTVNPLPVATLTSNGPVTASNPTVTLTAGGGNTYQFSPGATQQGGGNTATVTTPGQYQVTVTSNGCSAIASTTVTGAVSGSSCRNGSGVITVVASGTPVKYEWYRNSVNSARLTENPAQVRGTSTSSLTLVNQQVTADYYVRVTDANGSAVVDGPFRFTVNTGCNIYGRVAAEEVELRINLLGNPLQGDQLKAVISGAEGKALNVQLLDLQGRTVRQQAWQQADQSQTVDWSLGGQSTGLYLLQATTPDQRQSVKVIKQ